MKKMVLLAICMLILISILSPAVDAAPSPNLSDVKIIEIGNNASGNMFTPAGLGNTVYGNAVRLKVRYTGCPNFTSTFLYQNEALIGQVSKFETAGQYITGNGGVITGYIKTYTIPAANLLGNKSGYLGNFFVKAIGINGGSFSASVYDIILK